MLWKILSFFFSVVFNSDISNMFSSRINQSHFSRKPQVKIISFQSYNWYLINPWSDNALKGTVVNRALPSLQGGSFEITLTVPLNTLNKSLDKGNKKLQSSPYISKHDFWFQFLISTKLSSSLDTHKQGNKEKLSINSFSLITCNLLIWEILVRNQNLTSKVVFVVLIKTPTTASYPTWTVCSYYHNSSSIIPYHSKQLNQLLNNFL